MTGLRNTMYWTVYAVFRQSEFEMLVGRGSKASSYQIPRLSMEPLSVVFFFLRLSKCIKLAGLSLPHFAPLIAEVTQYHHAMMGLAMMVDS